MSNLRISAPTNVLPGRTGSGRAFLSRRWLGPLVMLLAVTGIALAQTRQTPRPVALSLFGLAVQAPVAEAPYFRANDAAMSTMLTTMTIQPTGDVDHDFVEMMVAHHQGAIDMAQALLRYGRNETLRRLAADMIATQQQEIASMRLALGERLPPPAVTFDQTTPIAWPTSQP